ncbi:MAG: NAD-dependent epimerase/dehydratase family protein [Verrucomicrobiota bacterium]|nr:NAD-dependent epimerase/dehydratase family protein [Verrucomicrobiota bacterium]
MRTVLIAGCGYTGTAAARLFARSGWSVVGWARSVASLDALLADAITARAVDISEAAAVARNRFAADVVVQCASSGGGGDEATYRAVYLEGARNLAASFPNARLIFVGSTSVYAQESGEEVTEESAAEPTTPTGKILRAAEQIALSADGIVLRAAGIYGPGRSALWRRLREGKATLSSRDRIVNQIHRDDLARAILLLAETAKIPSPRIFNVVDDAPSSLHAILRWLSARTCHPLTETAVEPSRGRRGQSNKFVRNHKLRALGWAPTYPTYVQAFENSILPSS